MTFSISTSADSVSGRLATSYRPLQHAEAPEPVQTGRAVEDIAPVALEQLRGLVTQVEAGVQNKTSELKFSIDTQSGKPFVRITDIKTGELIRQIPSQEMVEIARSIDRMQGLLMRQSA
jgi:flagellar protein FlaG